MVHGREVDEDDEVNEMARAEAGGQEKAAAAA